mmetsp:Transcript_2671/g.5435  ORF Transcript_2671/g.5435 Transcript_2671/m.5435 type:complete len:105 (+) Transcript_2671:28-342(+)
MAYVFARMERLDETVKSSRLKTDTAIQTLTSLSLATTAGIAAEQAVTVLLNSSVDMRGVSKLGFPTVKTRLTLAEARTKRAGGLVRRILRFPSQEARLSPPPRI